MSSVVPPVKVSDPVVQQMVDDISSVLRGVDDKYFPLIRYVNAERRDNQYIILFAAEGKGFRLGVICGTDGSFSGFQCVSNSGKSRSEVHPVNSPDDLRVALDQIGADLSRRK